MFNRDTVNRVGYGAPRQILANVDVQASVGCIVAQSVGTAVGTKLIAKAGTPIAVDFSDRTTPATTASDAVSESATAVASNAAASATVTAATFGSKVNNVDGTYIFTYVVGDGGSGWQYNGASAALSEYGIVITGNTQNDDTITITYISAKDEVEANAVLLHDVDVTDGDANGTALYIGVVNINRLDADVQELVTAGVNTVGGVTFMRC